jgi:predicted RND superfamily exporter protein
MNGWEWIIRRRWAVIVLSVVAMIVAGFGMTKLRMISDERVYFAKDDPTMIHLDKFENTYSREETVYILLAPKDGTVFTRKTLSAAAWLTEQSWMFPFASRVDSITNFQHTRAEGDDLFVGDLVPDPSSLTDTDIERIKRISLSEPALVDKIVSRSGHVTGINVKVIKPGKASDEDLLIAHHVRNVMKEFTKKFPGIGYYLAGDIIFNAGFLEEANSDMKTLIPIMFIAMVLVITFALRSFWGTLGTIIVIIASAVTGMGISGWLGIPLGDVASMAPTIVMTLAVADSIHILSTMFDRMRSGSARREAVAESLRINSQPVFLTSITTAVGFLSMNLTSSPVFHDLGNMVALGVMSAYFYSIFFLPAMMAAVPMQTAPSAKNKTAFADRLGNFVVEHRKPLFYGMGAVVVMLASGISQIRFDDKFIEYVSEKAPIRRAADFIKVNLPGTDALEYSLESGEEGGIADPAYLKNLENLEKWFNSRPRVAYVSSINDVMKRLNKTMHGDDPAWYRIPDGRELAAQYLLLYEMSLPFGLDLTTQINLDKSASRFRVALNDMSSMEMVRLAKQADKWMRINLPPMMHAEVTGLSIMFANLTARNVRSMLGGTMLALVLISAMIMWALKSFKIGLVSLLPNLVPAAMSFGLWGFAVGKVGLGIAVVAAMSLGIVVDDTVHFLSKYRRARREEKMNPRQAVLYSFHTVGTAIMATSAVLVVGFMILTFSGFKVNGDMGLLTAVTITFALVADLLFLPPLLMKMEGD